MAYSYKDYLRKQATDQLSSLKQEGQNLTDLFPELTAPQPQKEALVRKQTPPQQSNILGASGPVSQRFGVHNPAVEVFSKNGINSGTDFAVPVGTPVALPSGKWRVLESFNQAKNKGRIGDNTNRGYGNSVLAQNLETGEKLRFSHLANALVNLGEEMDGGGILGYSGDTGNVTGPHVDIEYYNQQGALADILASLYAQYLK